jgi:hypothetical protein
MVGIPITSQVHPVDRRPFIRSQEVVDLLGDRQDQAPQIRTELPGLNQHHRWVDDVHSPPPSNPRTSHRRRPTRRRVGTALIMM